MKLEHVGVDTLTLDPSNVRKHGDRQLESLRGSLKRFDQQKPIVVNKDGVVVAGNATLEAARAAEMAKVWIVRTELEGPDQTAYAIADNRLTDLSEWDFEGLSKSLASIEAFGIDLFDLGWSPNEAAGIIETDYSIEDVVPEPPDEAVTKPGDLITLGRHRLLCGDSAKAEDVDLLLEGAPIHLVNTDPPYNVFVEPSGEGIDSGQRCPPWRSTKAKEQDRAIPPRKSKPKNIKQRPKDRRLASDFLSDEDFDALLDAWFANIGRTLVPGGVFYVWGGFSNIKNYPIPLKRCGLYFAQAIIWDKCSGVINRKDFMTQHEWCFYGWREGAGHKFYGPNNITDVWSVKRLAGQTMVHLTEKPVELAARAIGYSSREGDNVLDLFGGSGSTLIAAEQLKRNAYLMEIDPLYCDVIVQRWETFTQEKAARCAKEPHFDGATS